MLSGFIWGPLLILLPAAGVYLTFKCGGIQFFKPGLIFKKTVGSLFEKKTRTKTGRLSPFQAVSTALAGTMGTGNIAGVATALVAGGPGAVFWMWVSAFFGMAIKYAEVLLAVKYRTADKDGNYSGGPMYYMKNALGAKKLAAVFCVLTVAASFGIGNISQVNSVAQSMEGGFGVLPIVTGVIVAALVSAVVMGGVNRIGRTAESLVPLMSILYVAASLVVIYTNRDMLASVFDDIFRSAFSLRSSLAGVGGFTVSRAVRFGMARGVFSNEAGLGSAPIAHACADTNSPVEQGFWGIFEVFADTIVCCTLTTLVIMTAGGGALWQSGLNGSALTSAAFETVFGSAGPVFVSISMVFFAFTSILGWYLYGEKSLGYLFGPQSPVIKIYKLAFLLAAVAGSVADLEIIWTISDILNCFMLLPNIAAVLLLAGTVKSETDRYFANRIFGKKKKLLPAVSESTRENRCAR